MRSGYDYIRDSYSRQPDVGARICERRRRQVEAEAVRRQYWRQAVAAIAAAILAALLATSVGMMLTERAATADSLLMSTSRTVGYRSVQIEAGDTLWSIADREMGEGWTDKQDFIRAVEQVNRLTDGVIHAGAYLCIPYYD